MKTVSKNILSILMFAGIGLGSLSMSAESILDLKHSISDDNVIAPESFETKVRELEENFYLKNYVAPNQVSGSEKLGTDAEYEQRLSQLPTEIEMPYNSVVGKFINMYLGKRRGLVANMLALHSYYGNIFVEELIKEGVPTELQYLPVIESAINPNAVSRAGAAGLWQFMPGTAKGLGMEVNSLVDERRDPRSSSRNAAKYLKQLYNIYEDWSLAIAAYNCGPGNVNKAIRRAGGSDKKDFWAIYNYLPTETRGYVPAFIAANYVMNYYKMHNISPTVIKRHLVTDTVTVKDRIHFQQISEVLNIPIEEIRMLNPQYRKDIIPGNNHPYLLTLPQQQCLSFLMSEEAIINHDSNNYAQRTHVEPGSRHNSSSGQVSSNDEIADNTSENASSNNEIVQTAVVEQTVKKTHVVARGENIRDIAKMYAVSATDIKRWNHLRRGKVKEGDQLIIEVVERQAIGSVETASTTVPAPPTRPNRTATAAVPPPPVKNNTPSQTYVPERSTSTPNRSNSTAQNNTSNNKPTNTKQQQQSKQQAKQPAKQQAKQQAKKQEPKTTTHTVKSGESLDKIARQNGTTVDAIRQANGLKKDLIQPGQKLKIPGKSTAKAVSTNTKKTQTSSASSHTVKSGESLDKIARQNGTTVEALRQANGLKKDIIQPGQKLTIPGKSASKKSKKR